MVVKISFLHHFNHLIWAHLVNHQHLFCFTFLQLASSSSSRSSSFLILTIQYQKNHQILKLKKFKKLESQKKNLTSSHYILETSNPNIHGHNHHHLLQSLHSSKIITTNTTTFFRKTINHHLLLQKNKTITTDTKLFSFFRIMYVPNAWITIIDETNTLSSLRTWVRSFIVITQIELKIFQPANNSVVLIFLNFNLYHFLQVTIFCIWVIKIYFFPFEKKKKKMSDLEKKN